MIGLASSFPTRRRSAKASPDSTAQAATAAASVQGSPRPVAGAPIGRGRGGRARDKPSTGVRATDEPRSRPSVGSCFALTAGATGTATASARASGPSCVGATALGSPTASAAEVSTLRGSATPGGSLATTGAATTSAGAAGCASGATAVGGAGRAAAAGSGTTAAGAAAFSAGVAWTSAGDSTAADAMGRAGKSVSGSTYPCSSDVTRTPK